MPSAPVCYHSIPFIIPIQSLSPISHSAPHSLTASPSLKEKGVLDIREPQLKVTGSYEKIWAAWTFFYPLYKTLKEEKFITSFTVFSLFSLDTLADTQCNQPLYTASSSPSLTSLGLLTPNPVFLASQRSKERTFNPTLQQEEQSNQKASFSREFKQND